MMRSRRIEALAKVMRLRLQVDQAGLAELQTKEAGLRKNLQDLVAQRDSQTHLVGNCDDPAAIARAGVQWQLWVDQRRRAINAELALLFAQKAEHQAKLSRSFGRDQATHALYVRARSVEDKMRRDRVSYES